jgi:hypothetical protein
VTFEELFSNPLVLLALGFVVAEWRAGRAGHVKAVQVDTNILARLENVEAWQRDHNTIHGCVQSLRATTEAMAKNVDRLTRRLDQWMAANPMPRRPARSPYDFPGARDWITEDEPDA